jgi:ATP-dependent Lon protease
LKIPRPTLEHLPALSLSVLRDLTKAEGEDESWVQPLDPDELVVVGRVWMAKGQSIRALQKILRGTLEARSACAMRH